MHGAGQLDVLVMARLCSVEEVDVDAVLIVSGADRCDGFESGRALAPPSARHGAGVINEEDGIEPGEEGIGIIRGGCGDVRSI